MRKTNERLEDVEIYSRIKVFEGHDEEDFKKMCQEFREELLEYKKKIAESDYGYKEDKDVNIKKLKIKDEI